MVCYRNKFCIERCLTLSGITNVFKTEKTEDQFKVGTYYLDLYFPEYKIVVECDENGQSLGGFPQQVLDAEIAYENAYPKQNDMGDDVVTAWGINAKGKDLLQRKTTYKVF